MKVRQIWEDAFSDGKLISMDQHIKSYMYLLIILFFGLIILGQQFSKELHVYKQWS